MKFKQYLFLLILCVFIFSCNKNGDKLNEVYHSGYHKSGIQNNGVLRVFTFEGEIIDTAVISRFNNLDSSLYSQFATALGYQPGRMDSILFSDAQHAILKDYNLPYPCLVILNGWNFLFVRPDTTTGVTYLNELSKHISYYIGQVKPEIISEYIYSSTRGDYFFGYQEKSKFVFNILGWRLTAPIIQYRLRPATVRSGATVYGYDNNYLEKDFFRYMEIGDTVTIQEYYLEYEK